MMNSPLVEFSFSCQKDIPFGKALYLVGSTCALGQWETQRAHKLKWTQGNKWHLNLQLPLRPREAFQYKYFIGDFQEISLVEWEKGPNRHFSSSNHHQEQELIVDEWNTRNLKIVFFSNMYTQESLDMSQQRIYVEGSSASLGSFSCGRQMDCVSRFSNMVGITYILDVKLSVIDDLLFYYKFTFDRAGQTSTSSLYVLRMFDLDESNHYLSEIVRKHGCMMTDQLRIFQMDENIYYGTIPRKNLRDLHTIAKLGFTSVVRFTTSSKELEDSRFLDESIYAMRSIEYIHYTINTDEKTRAKTLLEVGNLLMSITEGDKKVFLCSDSLSYLRKYLNIVKQKHMIAGSSTRTKSKTH